MIPKINFLLNFKSNFAAFCLYLFETYPGCTEDALKKINRTKLIKQIKEIKKKYVLEDDGKTVKKLLQEPRTLGLKIGKELFNHIFSAYKKHYNINKTKFISRAKKIEKFVKTHKIKEVLLEIEKETKIKWKKSKIDVWLVDIYWYPKEKQIDGTTTKEGIFIGLPPAPIDAFKSVFYHELIHANIDGKYNEKKEEHLAQILGIKVTRKILGKVPKQMIEIAKRRIKAIVE
jgi:hypothetical protein